MCWASTGKLPAGHEKPRLEDKAGLKARLLALTPASYTGLAETLARRWSGVKTGIGFRA